MVGCHGDRSKTYCGIRDLFRQLMGVFYSTDTGLLDSIRKRYGVYLVEVDASVVVGF